MASQYKNLPLNNSNASKSSIHQESHDEINECLNSETSQGIPLSESFIEATSQTGSNVQIPGHINNELKQHLSKASDAFLRRSYNITAYEITKALDLIIMNDIMVPERFWIDILLHENESRDKVVHDRDGELVQLIELQRRLLTLLVTFTATLKAQANSTSIASNEQLTSTNPLFESLLTDESNASMVQNLWNIIANVNHARENMSDPFVHNVKESGHMLHNIEGASLIHPSLVTAFAYASIRMREVELARQVLSMWFAKQQDDIGALLYEYADVRENASPSLKRFVFQWNKLYDLYGAYILPEMERWEDALDFLYLHSDANGGWVSHDHVEHNVATVYKIRQAKEVEKEKQAKKRLEVIDQAKKKAASREISNMQLSPYNNGRSNEKNARSELKASSSSQVNSTLNKLSSSQPSSSVDPKISDITSSSQSNAGNFFSFRKALTNYLSDGHSSQDVTSRTSSQTLQPSYMSQFNFSSLSAILWKRITNQPGRILGTVLFIYATLMWFRRNPKSLQRSVAQQPRITSTSGQTSSVWSSIWKSIFDTIKMGAGTQGF